MFSFLDFPYEIRKQIYDLSLLTPDFVCPYKASYEEKYDPISGYKPPQWASPADLAIGLLSTNSFIRNETMPIFYGKNTWHLTIKRRQCRCPWVHRRPKENRCIFGDCFDQFRKIHVSFDMRDLSREEIFRRADEWDEYYGEEDREAGDIHNIQDMHELLWRELASSWQTKMTHIQRMRLDELTIDLEHAFCSSACCKLHGFSIKNEVTLGAWHRPIDPDKGNETVEPNSFDGLDSRINLYPRPDNLEHIKIMITGLMPETKEVVLAHELGFACSMCKNKDGKLDVTDCQDLEEARRAVARRRR